MSASPAPALDAIAFQLAAALDQYELDVDALVNNWPGTSRYGAVSTGMDSMRAYSAVVRGTAVPFVALLIAHAELMHVLWRTPEDRAKLQEARDVHRRAITRLRKCCQRLLES